MVTKFRIVGIVGEIFKRTHYGIVSFVDLFPTNNAYFI